MVMKIERRRNDNFCPIFILASRGEQRLFTKALTRTKHSAGHCSEREASPISCLFWVDFEILSRGNACEYNVTKDEERLGPLLSPVNNEVETELFLFLDRLSHAE